MSINIYGHMLDDNCNLGSRFAELMRKNRSFPHEVQAISRGNPSHTPWSRSPKVYWGFKFVIPVKTEPTMVSVRNRQHIKPPNAVPCQSIPYILLLDNAGHYPQVSMQLHLQD